MFRGFDTRHIVLHAQRCCMSCGADTCNVVLACTPRGAGACHVGMPVVSRGDANNVGLTDRGM